MKLRRRYDELSAQLSGLSQQRELLLTQMDDEQAKWEKQQKVGVLLNTLRACWSSPLRLGRPA